MSSEPAVPPASREIRARPPRPEIDALQTAYLDLLKLALCDLGGVGTQTISWTGDRRVFVRTLGNDDEQLGWRIAGRDWPVNALTMVGLQRLDDVQSCVESVVRDRIPGDVIEAGSWRGGTAILMRATLDAFGDHDRTVWVADSFQGFPAPETDGAEEDRELEADMGPLAFLAPSLDEVKSHFSRFGLEQGVNFVPGFFEETMAQLHGRPWSVVRLDADTYKATKLTLEALYPTLAIGGYLISDDYSFLPACQRAIDEFREEHGIIEPIERVDFNGIRWRREHDNPSLPADKTYRPAGEVRARSRSERTVTHIPTDHELQLQDETDSLKDELRATQEELARLQRSAWVRTARTAKKLSSRLR